VAASARALTLVVASSMFLESLVGTVIATSLTAMAADLGVDPLKLKLAFTAYFVALAIFIPVSGWAADRFGARKVFAASVAVFTAGSVLCAVAFDMSSLVLGRFVQGLGGALMLPVGRLVLLRTIPRQDMVSAMAWLSIPALFAPIIGPPLGGYITTYYHWRGIFWLNVPVGLLALLLAVRLVPALRADQPVPLDVRGFVLLGSGLALAVFGFTLASGVGGAADAGLAAAMLLAGGALLLAYWRHAKRCDHPILALDLMAIASFRHCLVGGAWFRLSAGAMPFLLPMMLQLGFGLSAFASGMVTFSAAAGAVTMKLTASPILRRFGFRRVLCSNALITSALLAAVAAFSAATPAWMMVTVLLVGGFFRSLQFTGLNTLAYADVPDARLSQATGFVAVVQQLSLAAGVAVAAGLLGLSRAVDGRTELLALDFAHGFVGIALIASLSLASFVRLAPDAGAEVSGHRPG
jgi:EmrB/QacA subfamily drug resistance transporter